MRVWDLIHSEAFQGADENEPIWYADGSLGYVRLAPFGEVKDGRVVISKSNGKYILSPTDFDFMDEALDIYINPNVGGVPLTTQGCVVVMERCGIVIKEMDLI